MQFTTRRRRAPVINIVSMIDILVLLLIFFIVSTTFKKEQPSMEIQLPESRTATAAPAAEAPTVVSISGEGEVFVGPDKVDPDALAERLRATLANRPEAKLALKAEQSASFGVVVKVLDAFKEVGVRNVQAFAAPPGAGATPEGAVTP